MIYLDNAATGGFKPNAVLDTVNTVTRYLSANPGRSSHRLSLTGADIVYNTRKLAGEIFGASPDRVIFTKNCTESLNLAIFGTLKLNGHVITTVYEHNSVLRPLHALEKQGLISLTVVEPDQTKGVVEKIQDAVTSSTYLVITTAVSNVTGERLPIDKIGEICKNNGILYIVDGAQGGGHVRLNLKEQNVNALCLAGHKGLYGVMGLGLLIFDDQTEISPVFYGGTGTETFNLIAPESYPEKLEAGTLNLPGIAGLYEGLKYVKSNFNTFKEYLYTATTKLISMLNNLDKVTCYSLPNDSGIVSFSIDGISSQEVADALNANYDVAVRAGFHCAPLIHKHLNTQVDGLIRVSLAVQNSSKEINYLVKCLQEIIEKN